MMRKKIAIFVLFILVNGFSFFIGIKYSKQINMRYSLSKARNTNPLECDDIERLCMTHELKSYGKDIHPVLNSWLKEERESPKQYWAQQAMNVYYCSLILDIRDCCISNTMNYDTKNAFLGIFPLINTDILAKRVINSEKDPELKLKLQEHYDKNKLIISQKYEQGTL